MKKQQNFMVKMLAKRVKTEIEEKKEGYTYISTGDLLKAPWLHFRIGSTNTSYIQLWMKFKSLIFVNFWLISYNLFESVSWVGENFWRPEEKEV